MLILISRFMNKWENLNFSTHKKNMDFSDLFQRGWWYFAIFMAVQSTDMSPVSP